MKQVLMSCFLFSFSLSLSFCLQAIIIGGKLIGSSPIPVGALRYSGWLLSRWSKGSFVRMFAAVGCVKALHKGVGLVHRGVVACACLYKDTVEQLKVLISCYLSFLIRFYMNCFPIVEISGGLCLRNHFIYHFHAVSKTSSQTSSLL